MASSLASTSRSLLRSKCWASSYQTTRSIACSAPFFQPTVADTLPVSPPTNLPNFPVPEAYRSTSTPANAVTRPSFAPAAPAYRQKSDQRTPYTLNVYSTRNNTILTLSTSGTLGYRSEDPVPSPGVVAWVSAGSAGYKGAARGTYDAAVEVSLRMFKKIADLVDPPVGSGGIRKKVTVPPPTELEVVWNGFGQGRDAVFRSLMGGEGDAVRPLVKRVTDAVSPSA